MKCYYLDPRSEFFAVLGEKLGDFEFAFATDKRFTANTAGHLLKDRLRSGFRFDDVIKRLAGPIMTVTACGGLIGAVFVVLFSVWLSRRRVEGLSAGEAPAKTPVPV